ncbi:hypothetical protein D621_21675 [beta proteobacterium AAP51]|nr:hypothetical protein D621_21675 [beta proteobacterium AAP51]
MKCTASTQQAIALLTEHLDKVVKRKERYIEGRDAAKDKLSGNFEMARLFFGASTIQAIAAFEAFEKKNGNEVLEKLPPLDEWRAHASEIFESMKKEIRNDESKLAASPLGSASR